MHVDAMTIGIACVRKMNVLQLMPLHGHVRDIAELALIGELEAILAPKTGIALAGAGHFYTGHSSSLVKELELPLTAGQACVLDSQLLRTGTCPPQPNENQGYSNDQKV